MSHWYGILFTGYVFECHCLSYDNGQTPPYFVIPDDNNYDDDNDNKNNNNDNDYNHNNDASNDNNNINTANKAPFNSYLTTPYPASFDFAYTKPDDIEKIIRNLRPKTSAG